MGKGSSVVGLPKVVVVVVGAGGGGITVVVVSATHAQAAQLQLNPGAHKGCALAPAQPHSM